MTLQELDTYEIIESREISDVKSQGYILRHKKSGARVAVLSNEDDNKVFYIGFKTPPEDETGVPHIIEHTTLCGSDKFPVKDPFVELVKGSLNTFLNAMTYPDKTVYPLASYNDQDFKNLMGVYMDAVFHPNITKYSEIFEQEGWHYELESEEGPLTINGVVYNEMKGAYSAPEEVLQTQIFKSLFPDNAYSKNSGGAPEHIPELTYEDYLNFYHKYYHPSNAYIYLYGDMDVAERLQWMDENYLCHYDCESVTSDIPMQRPFEKVKEQQVFYPVSAEESGENQTYLAYNMVVEDALDKTLYQAFDVLDYALVSAPGAPIRQALIDAGIGEDVYGNYESGIQQPVFSIVAKNANPADKERFVTIIRDTLRQIVKEGINEKSLLAGVNSLEFRFREADFGQYPKGLLYGLQCLDSWIFDEMQPFLHLECLDTFAFLKEKVGSRYFEELIEKYLLNNTHGSIVMVEPKKGMNTQEEEALAAKLEAYKKSLTKEEVQALIERTAHLKAYQEEPSSQEDLEKLPMLTREDLKKEALPFSNIEEKIGQIPVVRHEVPTNGIDYITLMFEAGDVREEDIPYLGLLASVLGFVDTKSYSFSELANAINIYTGGISTGANVYPDVKKPGETAVKYEVNMKVLESSLTEALKLVDEILRTSKLTDTKRLGEIVAQVKARLQNSLSSAGHRVSAMRGLAGFSRYAYYQDNMRGIAYYRFICQVEQQLKEEADKVVGRLQQLCGQLFATDRLLVSFTAEKEAYQKAAPVLEEYMGLLQKESKKGTKPQLSLCRENQAFTDASQIQYVARTGNFAEHGFSYTGTLHILKMILSYDYLWLNIRVKGGAYGCMSSFMRTGEGYFVSYRDPNLSKTNQVYEGIPEYLRTFDPSERDMTKYIIGTFGSLDTPLYPEAKGSRSMSAWLEHISYEDIQRERDQIRNADAADIRALADLIQAVLADQNLCVIGNENMIQKESSLFAKIERLNP